MVTDAHAVTEIGPSTPPHLSRPVWQLVVTIPADMEAANVTTHYEQLRNEIIVRNRI